MGEGHPLTPFAAAVCASVALGLLIGAAKSCSFIEVNAKTNEILAIVPTSEQEAVTSTSLGVLCDGDFYDLEDDSMWKLSLAFFSVATAMGSVIVAIGWVISICIPPTNVTWKAMSYTAALTAVLQVPIFLMFETHPCADHKDQQECGLSTGSYLLMVSTIFWILVTMITQFLDPPIWINYLEDWRLPKDSSSYDSREPEPPSRARSIPSESSSFLSMLSIMAQRRQRPSQPLSRNTTYPLTREEEDDTGGSSGHDEHSAHLLHYAVYPTEVSEDQDGGESKSKAVSSSEGDIESGLLSGSMFSYGSPMTTGDESILDNSEYDESGSNGAPEYAAAVSGRSRTAQTNKTQDKIKPPPPSTELMDLSPSPEAGIRSEESEVVIIPEVTERKPVKMVAASLFGFADTMRQGRRGKTQSRYSLMDDEDMEPTYPFSSPPLEVVTVDGEQSDEEDLRLIDTEDDVYQDLLNDWNDLHGLSRARAASILDDNDDESSNTSSLDEESYARKREGFLVYGSLEEKNQKRVVAQARKRRRKKRGVSAGSVTSSPSLLEVTIEEERASDLESSDEEEEMKNSRANGRNTLSRTLSAPNLAGFPRSTEQYNVTEDLHNFVGMNVFHKVEVHRSDDEGSRPSRRSRDSKENKKDQDAAKIMRSSSSRTSRSLGRLVSRSLSPVTKSQYRIWREERKFRGGIHAPIVLSSSESSDEPLTVVSSPSRLRQARIRRLQMLSASSDKRRSRTLEPPKKRLSCRRGRRVSPAPAPEHRPTTVQIADIIKPDRSADPVYHRESPKLYEQDITADPGGTRLKTVSPSTFNHADIVKPDLSADRVYHRESPELYEQHITADPGGTHLPTVSPSASDQSPSAEQSMLSVSADQSRSAEPTESTFTLDGTQESTRFISPNSSECMDEDANEYFDDPSSFLLDNLDMSLAMLYRPEGAEYGPEENSI